MKKLKVKDTVLMCKGWKTSFDFLPKRYFEVDKFNILKHWKMHVLNDMSVVLEGPDGFFMTALELFNLYKVDYEKNSDSRK